MKKHFAIAALVLTLVVTSSERAQADAADNLARIEQDASRAARAMGGYLHSGQPAKLEVETLIQAYETSIDGLLKDRGFLYKTIPMPESYRNHFKDVQFPIYQIQSEERTALGRFAAEISRRYNIDVVYAPILLKFLGGEGLFFEGAERPFLVLSTDAPIYDSLSNFANRHEAVHLKFWAYRVGKEPDFLPRAPVHMSFQSAGAINPGSQSQAYQTSMNFEELVATTENVKASATAMQAAATGQEQIHLQQQLLLFKDVSDNAVIAAKKALSLLLDAPVVKAMPPLPHLHGQYFNLESSDFKMAIFLNRQEVESCGSQCHSLIHAKLEKALALAEFNLRFVAKFSESVPNEALLQEAVEFQKSQIDFMNSL